MEAFNDAWESTKDYIKEKTNPFLLTIIVVWLVHHWELVYAFFTVSSKITVPDRISLLKNYWSGDSFLCDLFKVIGISFIVLIVTQILIYTSRLIINYFREKVSPLVTGAFNKNKVIEKNKYDIVVKRNYELEKQILEEREARINAFREKEAIESNLSTAVSQGKEEERKEVYQAMRLLTELRRSDLYEFFEQFSESTNYVISPFTEQLRRRSIVVPKEEDELTHSQKLMLTGHGFKIKEILTMYQEFLK